jgi:hypothetical protein
MDVAGHFYPSPKALFFPYIHMLLLDKRLVIISKDLEMLHSKKKGVLTLGRGEHFNHKKKNHPGDFPSDSLTERHTTEAQEDEELIVTQEAFKNRVEED